MVTARLAVQRAAPGAFQVLRGVESYLRECGIERSLLELVKVRASQINRCAFRLDMHSKDALRHGETPQRLLLLDGWRKSPLYSERERAALAWADCLTRVADKGAPDEVHAALAACFSESEIADLTTAIGMINLWNRLMIGFGVQHPVAA